MLFLKTRKLIVRNISAGSNIKTVQKKLGKRQKFFTNNLIERQRAQSSCLWPPSSAFRQVDYIGITV